jgi:hypothetical protein
VFTTPHHLSQMNPFITLPSCSFKINFILISPSVRNRDSSVGIATGCGLDGRGVGVRVPVGAEFFYIPRRPDRFWGPTCLLSNGYCGSYPAVKQPGREANHSPPIVPNGEFMLSLPFLPKSSCFRS